MLKSFVHFLLLLGAVVSLSSQGVASAAQPCPAMAGAQAGATAGMDDCCDHGSESDGKGAPCTDMTAACLAMAGCVAPLGLGDGLASGAPRLENERGQVWQLTLIFEGRSVPPDLRPPARLG